MSDYTQSTFPVEVAISCPEKSDLYCTAGKDYLPLINGNGKSEDLTVHELVSLSPFIEI